MRWPVSAAAVILVGLVGLVGVMAYLRLAPADPAVWHRDSLWQEFPDLRVGLENLRQGENSAAVMLHFRGMPAGEALARIDAVAMATPRTTRLAGSVAEGAITWVTRSAIWGFPDYTTAQVLPGNVPGPVVVISARARFGKSDLGVNAARLREWVGQVSDQLEGVGP